jgi:uncharacterized membrane protein YjjP (DUF1212 family)
MHAFTRAWGVPVQIFALPSAVLASVGGEQLTLSGGSPGEPDLARLVDLHELARRVVDGELHASAALARLDAIETRPDAYGPVAVIAAFTLSAAAAAPVFGGGLFELLGAAIAGLVTGLAVVGVRQGTLVTTVAAMAVGATVSALARVLPLETSIPVITGLLVLLPGFSLTVGMAELANGHRITGSSRAIAAAMALLQLGFGVALGRALTESLGPSLSPVHVALPWLTTPWSVLSVALSFTVLLRAPSWTLPFVAVTTLIATHTTGFGATLLGGTLAPAVGALCVTLWSNLLSRRTGWPTAVTQVPGILLLVPGSLGFRAIDALMAGQAVAGVEVAFDMGLSATALVGGLLLGHALYPSRHPIGR